MAKARQSLFQRHRRLKYGFWIDHLPMVIDMNEARLETIEQIREFLACTAAVAFDSYR
jgi:hypothetical protein